VNRRRSTAVLVGLAAFAVASDGLSDTIDPAVPSVVVVGPPRGLAAQSRIDGARTGRSKSDLPTAPSELWRRTMSTIEFSPIVDDAGAIVVMMSSGDSVKLTPDGKEAWRTHLSGGGPAGAPVMLSDGTIGVLTTGGTFTGLSPDGKLRFSTQLGARGPDLTAPPLANDDGGAVVLAGRSFLTLDSDGAILTETLLPMRASSTPLATSEGWLVVADDGSVVRVLPPRQPTRVGTFEAPIDGGAVLADDRTLLGVMHDRLLALDLKTGLVSVRASVNSVASIGGPVAVGEDRTAYFTTSEGLLFGVDRSGQEVFKATVERVSTASAGYPGAYPGGYPQPYQPYYPPGGYAGYGGYGYGRPDPPIVADGAGHFAFLRGGGRLGIVEITKIEPATTDAPSEKKDPSAALVRVHVDVVTEHACVTPISVLPAGDKRIAVACREGIVALYGE
jgi:outer membrane protein assembly factor BamB